MLGGVRQKRRKKKKEIRRLITVCVKRLGNGKD